VHGENLAAMRDGRVTDAFLESLRPCSAEELRDPRFRFATIGVVSNVERASLNAAQALAFARQFRAWAALACMAVAGQGSSVSLL
jgi:hypothetical protein